MIIIPFKYYDKNYINPDYAKDDNPSDISEKKEMKKRNKRKKRNSKRRRRNYNERYNL